MLQTGPDCFIESVQFWHFARDEIPSYPPATTVWTAELVLFRVRVYCLGRICGSTQEATWTGE